MRTGILIAAIALAGCAGQTPEQRAAAEAHRTTPAGQAEDICRFKADVAMAPRRRGGLMDLALVDEEIRLRNQCIELYRRTGIMPSY
jgi:hypothetical protein